MKNENTIRNRTNKPCPAINSDNTPIVIDSDNEEDYTSSGISDEFEEETEDVEEENEVQNNSNNNYLQEGNILCPVIHMNCHINRQNVINNTTNVIVIPKDNTLGLTYMKDDRIILQTMSILAARYRYVKPKESMSHESEILSYVGPCPLYSLASSFGLDMHHGLSYFPCRDILAGGGSHLPCRPLWQHLTSCHNLNLSSSSRIISHLIQHGYSSPTPMLFNSSHSNSILRTTPRFALKKQCPLTRYGAYGIQYEHGARLCSGCTFNTNIYSHLISFHKLTPDASLRLSRAVAFNDRNFQFNFNETIVQECIQYPTRKFLKMKRPGRLQKNHLNLFKKITKKIPVQYKIK